MTVTAKAIAVQARRTAVITAIRARPWITLAQLGELMESEFSADLEGLTISDLRADSLEQQVLRLFKDPGVPVMAGDIRKALGVERWVSQDLLTDMVERGLLVRSGRTSGTRYTRPFIRRRYTVAAMPIDSDALAWAS